MYHEEIQGRQLFLQRRDTNSPQCSYRNPPSQGLCLEPSSMAKNVAVFPDKKRQQPATAPAELKSQSNPSNHGKKSDVGSKASTNKARRVRTGCLTCRERHLKCDEAVPDCMNCRKRGRECKRGIRLNFLDVNVHSPEHVPDLEDWTVEFQDESREIASEYKGGLSRYAPYDSKYRISSNEVYRDGEVKSFCSNSIRHPTETSPKPQLALDDLEREKTKERFDFRPSPNGHWRSAQRKSTSHDDCSHSKTNTDVSNVATPPSSGQSSTPDGEQTLKLPASMKNLYSPHRNSEPFSPLSMRTPATVTPMADFGFSFSVPENASPQHVAIGNSTTPERDCLDTPDEIRYMQAFVQEVGVWLDSFNKERYFSHMIPHYALKSTMLLNALLACGAKHLSLTLPNQGDQALYYHNTATSQLLRNLQNPDRNTEECATTAVVLNAYEFMSEKPAHRMRHVSGARALILECAWNASSSGAGAACFWQNITMEVLICLSTNWQTTWDPEEWGLNHDLLKEGDEELGLLSDETHVHMIVYIVAKIVNFRATILASGEVLGQDNKPWLRERLREWQGFKRLCERWNNYCPRTMQSYGYMTASESSERSLFPCIWLIQRTAILGRLFYHTAEFILAQHHPIEHMRCSERNRMTQMHHSHQVCGIVAHTQDRGVAPVAIRCLAVAASALTKPKEQVEVLDIMGKIKRQSGWHLNTVEMELKRTWGWESNRLPVPRLGNPTRESCVMPPPLRPPRVKTLPNPTMPLMTATRVLTPPTAAMAPVNPLSFANFSLPNHPYQNWYEPPSRPGPEVSNEW